MQKILSGAELAQLLKIPPLGILDEVTSDNKIPLLDSIVDAQTQRALSARIYKKKYHLGKEIDFYISQARAAVRERVSGSSLLSNATSVNPRWRKRFDSATRGELRRRSEYLWALKKLERFLSAGFASKPVTEYREQEAPVSDRKPARDTGARGNKTDPLSTPEGKRLLKAAGQEAVRLYQFIRKFLHDPNPEIIESKTKEVYKECVVPWQYIDAKYLDDPCLYQLREDTRERKFFVGRLLQKILKDKKILEPNCQMIYVKYLKVK